VGREAAALRAGLSLPELPAWPTAALKSAGLQDEDIAGIRTILAAYDRTNAMALIAFLAVQLRLEGAPPPLDPVAGHPASASAEPVPDLPLPPLLALADMSPMAAELVLAINGLGAIHRKPTFCRHPGVAEKQQPEHVPTNLYPTTGGHDVVRQ
jgi:hypothetical protein